MATQVGCKILFWEALQPLHKVLPIFAVLLLSVGVVPAQERLPASTQMRLAIWAHVESLGQSDLPGLLSEAQCGDRKAEHLLALVYGEGRLVPKDLATARTWMLKSAEQGYVPAQGAMGEMYLNNVRDNGPIPDYGDAERWLRLAATQGDTDAQSSLGTGYQRGWFGTTDYREALKWLRKAAAQGLPDAQFSLGQMYEEGEGVPENYSWAATWYRKAADHVPEYLGGVWEAETQLAYMYRDGHLPEDNVQAYMWFAIVGDDMKRVAQHMTKAQILQAQRMAEDWIKRHPRQLPSEVATSAHSAQ
jgi:TPR repeat protein